tara:strand:+ start:1163 stop:2032 length:870 start_codon:yes stop_codon:yes gene_type:complete
MKLIYLLLFISNIYSRNIHIEVSPDSVYVGSQAQISIYVNNIKSGDIVTFTNLNQNDEVYSIIDRILESNTLKYTIQFWKQGVINLNSIEVSIKTKNDIIILEAEEISINVYSNILVGNNIKPIKEMNKIDLNSKFEYFIYIIIILLSLFIIYLLINNKKKLNNNKLSKQIDTDYYYIKTIKKLESIQIPKEINQHTTEIFYIELNMLFRKYIKNTFHIRATEMTNLEIETFCKSINLDKEIINKLQTIHKISDKLKYAGNISDNIQFSTIKEQYKILIKLLNEYNIQS